MSLAAVCVWAFTGLTRRLAFRTENGRSSCICVEERTLNWQRTWHLHSWLQPRVEILFIFGPEFIDNSCQAYWQAPGTCAKTRSYSAHVDVKCSPIAHEVEHLVPLWWCSFERVLHIYNVETRWKKGVDGGRRNTWGNCLLPHLLPKLSAFCFWSATLNPKARMTAFPHTVNQVSPSPLKSLLWYKTYWDRYLQ